MSEMELLLKQKKEIEDRIKELKSKFMIRTDLIKFEQKDSSDNDNRCWQVAASGTYMKRKYTKTRPYDLISEEEHQRWYPFIHEKTKDEAVKTIREIVRELQKILQKVEGDEA